MDFLLIIHDNIRVCGIKQSIKVLIHLMYKKLCMRHRTFRQCTKNSFAPLPTPRPRAGINIFFRKPRRSQDYMKIL